MKNSNEKLIRKKKSGTTVPATSNLTKNAFSFITSLRNTKKKTAAFFPFAGMKRVALRKGVRSVRKREANGNKTRPFFRVPQTGKKRACEVTSGWDCTLCTTLTKVSMRVFMENADQLVITMFTFGDLNFTKSI